MSTMKQSKERLYDIIKRPLITEKSMVASSLSQYTFEVAKDATKIEIAQSLLNNGVSHDIVMQSCGLSREALEAML